VGWLYKTDTFEVSGAASTVHAEGGLPVSSGSVLRMVVELTDPPTARLTIDTGQSGTPGTPHAFDQFPAWNSFAPPPFPVTRAEVEAQVEARVLLVP
jgi:acyl-homoserine lactone acylase PvdQ